MLEMATDAAKVAAAIQAVCLEKASYPCSWEEARLDHDGLLES